MGEHRTGRAWRAGLLSVALGTVGVAWAQTAPPLTPSSPTIGNPDTPNVSGATGQQNGQGGQPPTTSSGLDSANQAGQPGSLDSSTDPLNQDPGSTTPDPNTPASPQPGSNRSVGQPINSADRATGAIPSPVQPNDVRNNQGQLPTTAPLDMGGGMGGGADAGY